MNCEPKEDIHLFHLMSEVTFTPSDAITHLFHYTQILRRDVRSHFLYLFQSFVVTFYCLKRPTGVVTETFIAIMTPSTVLPIVCPQLVPSFDRFFLLKFSISFIFDYSPFVVSKAVVLDIIFHILILKERLFDFIIRAHTSLLLCPPLSFLVCLRLILLH